MARVSLQSYWRCVWAGGWGGVPVWGSVLCQCGGLGCASVGVWTAPVWGSGLCQCGGLGCASVGVWAVPVWGSGLCQCGGLDCASVGVWAAPVWGSGLRQCGGLGCASVGVWAAPVWGSGLRQCGGLGCASVGVWTVPVWGSGLCQCGGLGCASVRVWAAPVWGSGLRQCGGGLGVVVIIDVHFYLMQGYFDAIKQSPFQYHHNTDELAEVFFNPDHQGYLTKEGTFLLLLPLPPSLSLSLPMCRREAQELEEALVHPH